MFVWLYKHGWMEHYKVKLYHIIMLGPWKLWYLFAFEITTNLNSITNICNDEPDTTGSNRVEAVKSQYWLYSL